MTRIRGRVIDADGHAAAGIRVRLLDGRAMRDETESHEDGTFEFGELEGVHDCRVVALVDGVEVAHEKVTRKSLLKRAARIELRVPAPVAAGSTASPTSTEGTTMEINPNELEDRREDARGEEGGVAAPAAGDGAPAGDEAAEGAGNDGAAPHGGGGGGNGGGVAAPPAPPAAAPPDEFDFLVQAVADPRFDLIPPVNIDEARQFRRLFTVGNYVLARVPASIAALDAVLKNGAETSLALVNRQALLNNHGAAINSILQRMDDGFNNETELLKEVRRQFDLGTQPVPQVNTSFKTLYRQFVALCADDLLGVDPQVAEGRVSFDDRQGEEIRNFLKRLKRSLIQVMESMSIAGTLGTNAIILKWSQITGDALIVLRDVSTNHVASDDEDQRHIWSVVAALNRRPKTEIDGHLVAAREGAELLDHVIRIYERIRATGNLSTETPEYLRTLFYNPGEVFANGTVAERLKRNASFVLENWIPGWA